MLNANIIIYKVNTFICKLGSQKTFLCIAFFEIMQQLVNVYCVIPSNL